MIACRRFAPEDALARAVEVLRGAGLTREAARDAALVMVDADRRGHASHGLTLLPLYVERIRRGGIKVAASPVLAQRTPTVFTIDADGGIGAHAARQAAELAAAEARKSGICAVGVRNNNHVGMLAGYRSAFQDAGVVGLILNISGPSVAPPGGSKATIGSNALCLVVPRRSGEPFCIDMGTGIVAAGKIREAAREGRPVPASHLLDPSGQPTTDPHLLDRGGAIPVFGGHKGLGVHLMIEILAGALAGATLSPAVGKQRKHPEQPMFCSQLFVGMDPAPFGGMDLDAAVDALRGAVRGSYADEPEEPFFPDQLERRHRRATDADGIPVSPEVARLLDRATGSAA